MKLKGMSSYELTRDPYDFVENSGPAARTLERVPKQCLVFEAGLAPGPPLCRVDQDNSLYGLLKGNSWFRLCWDPGFLGSW